MKKLLFLVIGMLILIGILTGVLLLNKKLLPKSQPLQEKPTPQVQNSSYAVPTANKNLPTENCKQFPLASGCGGVVGAPINICSKQYPNYPPLGDIVTTKADPKSAKYEGIISKIDVSLHAITVISDRSGNSFIFNGGSVNGKIVDATNTPVNNFYSLKTKTKAVISFTCDQKNGYFTLNQFQLSQ